MEFNYHQSVLLEPTISILDIKEDGIYVDATLGRGGHSEQILNKLTTGHLYCFDRDIQAINYCKDKFKNNDHVTLIKNDFSNLKEELSKYKVSSIDGILYDLGVSSPQFDDPKRGFSYRFDAKLDMRMDQQQTLDAYKVVNTYSVDELTYIFKEYGEEKFAYKIAKEIVKQREIKPIETTFQLVDVIKSALPNKVLASKGHPAKQVFQALRIEVNQELVQIKDSLQQALDLLNVDGVCAVITFQSLEDRIVKQKFKEICTDEKMPINIAVIDDVIKKASFQLLTKKGIVADGEELKENNRAHSARLRAVKRISL